MAMIDRFLPVGPKLMEAGEEYKVRDAVSEKIGALLQGPHLVGENLTCGIEGGDK